MRILQVISSFPPAFAFGGAPKVAYELSKELVKRGHEVTVFTTDAFDSKSRYKYEKNPLWLDGIEVYHFRNLNNNLAYKNFPIACDMLSALNKNVESFDLIHLHEYRSFQAYFIYKYAKKYNIPYLIQPHGSAISLMDKFSMKKLFDKFIGNKIMEGASKIVALTEFEARTISEFNIDKKNIEIIPNGIDLSEFSNLPEKGLFRRKYNISNEEKIILYLGRLHKIKGINLLLESFKCISNNNLKLVIAGPDEGCLLKLEKLAKKFKIEDQIIFTGPLYRENKLQAYVDADVYVLPSIYEIFGITLLESILCGTPVLCTKDCGISDIIHEKAGLAVVNTVNGLKEGLLFLLNNPKKLYFFEKNGWNVVENEFDIEKIVSKTEKLYKKMSDQSF